jgi:predicted nucleic acid-binding protein
MTGLRLSRARILIAELRRVLVRPRFRRWFAETSAQQLVVRLERHATMHDDPPAIKGATRDPKDPGPL